MAEFETITSKDNSRLKTARAVRDGKVTDSIFIEGRRLVNEAILCSRSIGEVFVTERFLGQNDSSTFIDQLRGNNVPIKSVSSKLFDSIADATNSQGIIAIADRPVFSLSDIEANVKQAQSFLPLVILADSINNPANLGAIVRTAAAAGAAGVILTKGSTDAFSPKALRGSMGACFRIPIVEDREFEEIISWAKQIRLSTTAAVVDADFDYCSLEWTKPRLLVLGSEAHGLDEEQIRSVADLTRIPMQNGVESLNLGVAAGVILYEAVRQNTR